MKIIGLIGGIASGKSAVAQDLAALGAVVLNADQAAHQVINIPSVQQALVARWGDGILKQSESTGPSKVDRAAAAEHLFPDQGADRNELRFLESLLHPKIRQQFEAELARLASAGTAIAVIDAPLLLEAGWESLCDHLVLVDSPRTMRLERARLRNWTEQEFAKREACQLPIAIKRERSTHILANAGTRADLRNEVQAFWSTLEITNSKT